MLKHRLPSALLLGGIAVLILTQDGCFGRWAFILLGILLNALATTEFISLIQGSTATAPIRPHRAAMAYAVLGFILLVMTPASAMPMAMAIWLVGGCYGAGLSLVAATDRPRAVRTVVATAAALVLVFVPLNCLAMIYFQFDPASTGRQALLFLVVVTKCGDIGGYVVGTLTANFLPGGNHKMTPRLSPKKSYEGMVGGLLLSLGAAWALRGCLPVPAGQQVAIALAVGTWFYFGGLLGDLNISALKRAAGAKDSGNLIPGMGGVLDVVDSLLFNAPLAWLLLQFA